MTEPAATTFLLVPGAGGQAWYWHRVVPLLEAAGARAIPVDLPAADDGAGLAAYVTTALAALAAAGGAGGSLVVVGQSMGGLTAPLLCRELRVDRLVLLNAMIPRPGESGGEWWSATGQAAAAAEFAREQGRPDGFELVRDFFNEVPGDVLAAAMARGEPAQSDTPMRDPWPLDAWPDVPTRVLTGRQDRLFPPAFQRRVARERLGLPVVEVPGGHLSALGYPDEVAAQLLGFAVG